MKKFIFSSVLIICSANGFANGMAGKPPKGAIRNGTLGNPVLVNDAMLAAGGQATSMGCDHINDGRFFVKKDPTGKQGERTWKEIWQFQCKNGNYDVEMTFMESKQGGVSFTASENK